MLVARVKRSRLQLMVVFTAVLIHFSTADSLRGRGMPGVPSTDVPVVDYLIGLRAQLANEEGIPKNVNSAPTSVWCLKEKAVIDTEVRQATAASRNQTTEQCEMISEFLFNWEPVANATSVALTKSILRVYQLTSSRVEEAVPITISASIQLFYSNMTRRADVESAYHLLQTTVANVSNRWIELDITALMLPIWSSIRKEPPIIEVKLKTEVDCINHKKVPVQFVNPAEVDLNDTILRQECMMSQPLLIIFLEDQALKKVILDKQNLIRDEEALARSSGAVGQGATRQKRSTQCHLEDFILNFYEFGSQSVVYPPTFNMSTCIGSCKWNDIRYLYHAVPFHAFLLSEAKYLNDTRAFISPHGKVATMYSLPHKNPCCTPTKYSSAYFILHFEHLGYVNLLQNDIRATECQCR